MAIIITMEVGLEEIGWIATPAEQSLPSWIFVIVSIATYTTGLTLFIGLPAAIVIIMYYGRDIGVIVPAVLLSGAVLFLSAGFVWGQGIDAIYVVGGILLFLYGCTATAAGIRTLNRS